MSGGLLVSATQCTTLPSASLTSNFRKQCGLAQNHSETVAFKVTFFPLSKFELPWCPKSGSETARRPAVIAKLGKSLPLIKASTLNAFPSSDSASNSSYHVRPLHATASAFLQGPTSRSPSLFSSSSRRAAPPLPIGFRGDRSHWSDVSRWRRR